MHLYNFHLYLKKWILQVLQQVMSSAAAEAYFSEQFQKDLEAVGADLRTKYAPIIRSYNQVVIPFERKRMQEHQSIIFENSSLEQNKIELISKLEQHRSENDRLEHALQLQHTKIRDLQSKIKELEQLNNDNASVIASLRIRNDDYKQAIDHKNTVITQLEKEKQILLQKFQERDSQYHIVLANCMKDKNLLADKLNHLNQMEQLVMDKEKQLKAQQFYLKKQWEEFEEASKAKETPQPPKPEKKTSRIFGNQIKPSLSLNEDNLYGKKDPKKEQKNVNNQILKTPLKKIVKHHQSQIYDICFNYNGNMLTTCGGDRYVRIYDVNNSRIATNILSQSSDSLFISVALDYGGERLLTGSTDKVVSIYSTQSGKALHSFLGHGDKVNSVTWTSSKERCASGSDDKQLKIWDIEKTSNVLSVNCQKGLKVVRSNNVQPVVYTGHTDGSVRVYSISQGNSPISQIKGVIDYAITSLTLLSNRHQILATSMQGSVVHLLDFKMNKSITKYEHGDFFNSSTHATVSPSESLVLAGNCDGSIYYWDKFKGGIVKRVTGHDGPVTALQYHFMSSILATADKEGSLILWQ